METEITILKQAVEKLTNKVSRLEFDLLKLTTEFQKAGITKPAKKESGLGIPVWNAYEKAFEHRYGFMPPRSAKSNKACADMAKRLGTDAAAVAKFYVEQNDPVWIRLHHPIGVLYQNCESVFSMWKTGKVITYGESRQIEKQGTNMNASREFLEKKYGRK